MVYVSIGHFIILLFIVSDPFPQDIEQLQEIWFKIATEVKGYWEEEATMAGLMSRKVFLKDTPR